MALSRSLRLFISIYLFWGCLFSFRCPFPVLSRGLRLCSLFFSFSLLYLSFSLTSLFFFYPSSLFHYVPFSFDLSLHPSLTPPLPFTLPPSLFLCLSLSLSLLFPFLHPVIFRLFPYSRWFNIIQISIYE